MYKLELQILMCFLASITSSTFAYEQNDYNLTNERMEVIKQDRAWVAVKIGNFKFNRTSTAINFTITIKQDLGREPVFNMQAYRFASNEYRLFPVTFGINFCDTLEKNDFGLQNIYRCGNFSGCPLRKGSFHICNWLPDASKFPPHLPDGRYRLDVGIYQGSVDMAEAQWFFMIEKRFFFN